MRPRRKPLVACLSVLLCAMALYAAWSWYQDRYIRPFDARATLFSGAPLRLPADLAGPGPVRLVHFWDPACPCNVGNQQHLAGLVERFAPQGVVFYSVQRPGSHGRLPANLVALTALDGLPGLDQLPASPAVGIWDRQGRLAYFGPYSEGALCTSANSFIEPVLEALLAGRPVDAANTLAQGCFCDWHPAP